jgi:hypothetical protein
MSELEQVKQEAKKSDLIIKKLALRKSFVDEFDNFNTRLKQNGAQKIELDVYIQILKDGCPIDVLENFIEHHVPLRSKLISALDDAEDLSFQEEIKRLLEKRDKRMKSKAKDV